MAALITTAMLSPLVAKGADIAVSLSSSVDRAQVPRDGQITLTVTASWDGPADALRFDWPTAPVATNLVLMGSNSGVGSSSSTKGPVSSKHYRYTFAPTEIGHATIDAVSLGWWPSTDTTSSVRILRTQPVVVTVGPSSKSVETWDWIDIALVAAAVGVAVFLTWSVKRKRRPKEITDTSEGARAGLEAALERLPTIRISGDSAGCYQYLWTTLAGYIETRWSLEAVGRSTEAVGKQLDQIDDIKAEHAQALRETLESYDHSRFAPGRLDAAALDRDVESLRHLVDMVLLDSTRRSESA